jgi:BMFP domain-containing protein YqiC
MAKGLLMQSENRLFDDVARMASGALNMLTGLKNEVEGMVRNQMESWMAGMNLVTREEFEVARQMAATARDEQEALKARIAALEAKLGAKPTVAKAAAKPKSKAQAGAAAGK